MAGAKVLLALACGLALWLGGNMGHVAAAKTTAPLPGITLSPFLQQLTLAPDQATSSFMLHVTNHTVAVQQLQLSARDFGSLDETGGVLLEGSRGYNQKYGLASWISLETDKFTLEPKESREVTITITNQTSLRPGGHYGAIAAAADNPAVAGNNQVGINRQLLSLILLTKTGGEHYDLRLKQVKHNGNWFHLPTETRLRFENPGNVHVVPRGLVRLKSPAGTVIAQGIINTESAYILPETSRELYVPLTPIAKAWPLPGLYRLEVAYRYDGIQQAAHQSSPLRFVSVGLYLLLIALGIVGWRVYRHRKKAAKKSPPTK